MLTRLDDALIDHDKVEKAGEKLGKQGYLIALGALAWAVCYANKKLTDGVVPDRAVAKYGVSQATAEAMVSAGLWERIQDGYRIHDFHDWNPTANAVKDKRKRDRERKRVHAGFREESSSESNGNPSVVRPRARAGAPADQDRTGEGMAFHHRRHPLDEEPGISTNPDTCERAERYLPDFAKWHLELRGARFVGKYERDQPEALRLVVAYTDEELRAITRLYLQATGPRYDSEPRSPGRLRDAAGEMEKRLKESGQWPSAA